MKRTAAKMIRALCGMVVMLVLAASITSVPALAASNGIYIATATPHYRHPTTGVIEDAGGDGSAVLGQSMTESALYRQALVEVDPQGNTYVTIRMKLMDNIQNPQFQVDGSSVSASLMQEDYSANTADYRMRVNSEYSVIRCNMYVIAMGREVVFYITVSGLQSGSSDFITSVTVEEPEQEVPETPAETEHPTEDEPETTTPAEGAAADNDVSDDETKSEQPDDSEAGNTKLNDKDKNTASAGLQEFDAEGNKVEEENSAETETESSYIVWWVLGGIVIVLAAGGCVWYFGFFKKKK